MKTIDLGGGNRLIVDDKDHEYISRFHWTVRYKKTNGTIEAVREFCVSGKGVVVPAWKFIIAAENNKDVLYLNRDSLDVRKSNLRLVPAYIASHRAMKKGRGYNGKPTSKYKGVSYAKTYAGHKKWVAGIVCESQRFTGHFHTEREAAEFYNEKARELYGEFAYQNIIE